MENSDTAPVQRRRHGRRQLDRRVTLRSFRILSACLRRGHRRQHPESYGDEYFGSAAASSRGLRLDFRRGSDSRRKGNSSSDSPHVRRYYSTVMLAARAIFRYLSFSSRINLEYPCADIGVESMSIWFKASWKSGMPPIFCKAFSSRATTSDGSFAGPERPYHKLAVIEG